MFVRGEGGKLKYEFVVQPGAKVEDIRLAYWGRKASHWEAGASLG